MNKVIEFLNANPVQYLATVGRDGKAIFEKIHITKRMMMIFWITKKRG